MTSGIHWMASAMLAAKAKLEVAADNLANASSDGFHKRLAQTTASSDGLSSSSTVSLEKGMTRYTGRTMDLALLGPGSFTVAAGRNPRLAEPTRSGAFMCDRNGYVVDRQGRTLIGKDGAFVRLPRAMPIAADGTFRDGNRVVAQLGLPRGSSVRSGFLEGSNVNAIGEMIDVIDAQRAFETAQKTLSAIDETRSKAANDVGQIK
jgi:flagellar basal-body rod protein FlgF